MQTMRYLKEGSYMIEASLYKNNIWSLYETISAMTPTERRADLQTQRRISQNPFSQVWWSNDAHDVMMLWQIKCILETQIIKHDNTIRHQEKNVLIHVVLDTLFYCLSLRQCTCRDKCSVLNRHLLHAFWNQNRLDFVFLCVTCSLF